MTASFISSGVSSSGVVVTSGNTLEVLSGGTASGTIVSHGGVEEVSGTDSAAEVKGILDVFSGGSAIGDHVDDGGVVGVAQSGLVDGTIVENGGLLFVESGASVENTTVSGGGQFQVYAGGVASGSVILSGGLEQVYGSDSATQVGGTLIVYSGGTVSAPIIAGGTLELTAADSVGGPITFTAAGGVLQAAADGLVLSNTLTLSGSVTIDAQSHALTLSGLVSGDGSLTESGTGTLTLTASNTYTGGTTIDGGTLAVTDNAALGTGALAMTSGATLEAAANGLVLSNAVTLAGNDTVDTQSNAFTLSGPLSGVGSLTKSGAGTLTLTGSNGYAGATNVNSGTLIAGTSDAFSSASDFTIASGAVLNLGGFNQTIGSLSGAGTVTNFGVAAATLTAGVDGASTSFSGLIQNGTAITALAKSGAGTLTLTSANTYSGGTSVIGGLINFNAADNFGSGFITLDGGGLQWANGNTTDISSQLNAFGSNGATFDTNGNNVTLASALSGSGGLTKAGIGSLTLSGPGAYAGATNINSGTLIAGATDVFSSASAFTIASGALLDLAGFNETIGSLGGAGTVTNGGGAAVTLTTGADGTSTSFSGVIQYGSAATALAKTGAGTLTLTNTDAYSGGTSVTGGLIDFNAANNFGSGLITLNGGGLQWAAGTTTDISSQLAAFGSRGATFDTNGNDVTFASALSGSGSLTKAGAGTLTLTGTNSYTGETAINAGTLALDTNGDNVAMASSISGSGSLAKEGAGTLTLSGDNTYAGGTTLDAGTLAVGNSAALGTGSLTFATGTTLQAAANGLALSNNMTLAGSDTVDTQDNALTLSGLLSGAGSLTETGSGTLALTNTNTYSGGTTIDGGTLELGNASAAGGSTITFASGANATLTLDSAAFQNTISGLAPGDAIDLTALPYDFDGTESSSNQNNFVLTVVGFNGTSYQLNLASVQFTAPVSTGLDAFYIAAAPIDVNNWSAGTQISLYQYGGPQPVICFMPGTLIRTPTGEQAIERFKRGDLVQTADGLPAPVYWVGRQTVSLLFADRLRALPIRVRAGALADNVPVRDLLVSPDHALLVDDVLVQAGALVNGTSITRETNVPITYTYYHLELDDHSLILAENVAAETFVDNVDRLAFDNWDEHEALYPNGKPIVEMPYPRAKAYRQVPRHLRDALLERGRALYGTGERKFS